MVKQKPRMGRHGLPVKTERILVAVTAKEKRRMQELARGSNMTLSSYLLLCERMCSSGYLEFTPEGSAVTGVAGSHDSPPLSAEEMRKKQRALWMGLGVKAGRGRAKGGKQ